MRHVRKKRGQYISGQVLKQVAKAELTPPPRISTSLLMETYCLYRHYDASGALLYVGVTNNAPGRFREHYAAQPWRTQVATSKYEHYVTRGEAELAEAWAITTEHPLHNRQRPVPTGPRPTPVSSSPPGAPPPIAKNEGSDGGERGVIHRDAAHQLGTYGSSTNPPRGTSDVAAVNPATRSETDIKPLPNRPQPRSPVDRITRLSPRLLASRIRDLLKPGWPPGSADDG